MYCAAASNGGGATGRKPTPWGARAWRRARSLANSGVRAGKATAGPASAMAAATEETKDFMMRKIGCVSGVVMGTSEHRKGAGRVASYTGRRRCTRFSSSRQECIV